MENLKGARYRSCVTLCGWYGRQTISLFWRETKQRPALEISDETGSGEGKAGPRQAKRVSWRRETQRGSRERTAKRTSQDELAVQIGQRSAEGGSEEDGQR